MKYNIEDRVYKYGNLEGIGATIIDIVDATLAIEFDNGNITCYDLEEMFIFN